MVRHVVASARLEGHHLPGYAVALMAAYARGELTDDEYLAGARRNIA